jgi:hypothetical protein
MTVARAVEMKARRREGADIGEIRRVGGREAQTARQFGPVRRDPA